MICSLSTKTTLFTSRASNVLSCTKCLLIDICLHACLPFVQKPQCREDPQIAHRFCPGWYNPIQKKRWKLPHFSPTPPKSLDLPHLDAQIFQAEKQDLHDITQYSFWHYSGGLGWKCKDGYHNNSHWTSGWSHTAVFSTRHHTIWLQIGWISFFFCEKTVAK